MAEDKKGVILLNLGGPDSTEAVKPFLFNLFSDREIIKLGPWFLQKPLARLIASRRAGKAEEYYRQIGDGSPLLDLTMAQAEALEERLEKEGKGFKAYVGMRYWHPFITDAVKEITDNGVTKLIALPLFPQFSRATTGSCFNELARAAAAQKEDVKISYIQSYYDHPLYIKALSETISEGLSSFTGVEEKDISILFSAHALPQKFVDDGDPYVDQIKATISAVTDRLGIGSWSLSFQSRSGPVKWIGPETKEVIKQLAAEGVENLLIVPVSFVSDHVETLYEMDILYKELGSGLGIKIERAPSLNVLPVFIEALAEIIVQSEAGGKD
jgi:protoporphyrin/coproporphyrin ferrochelatase